MGAEASTSIGSVWVRLEGQVVDDQYPLRRYLGSSDHSGVFLTESAKLAPSEVALKLVAIAGARAESQLARWHVAASFAHPHLVRLLAMERANVAGLGNLYAVMEYADQDLAQLLQRRALTEEETREMLVPTLSALAFLHERKLVLGRMKPSNVLVVGDQLKLASDAIRPAGEVDDVKSLSVYDPPEARDGSCSTAGDIWALGVTICEALTRRQPLGLMGGGGTVVLPPDLPQAFREIVAWCLRRQPQDRPDVAELDAWLSGQPVPEVVSSEARARSDGGAQSPAQAATTLSPAVAAPATATLPSGASAPVSTAKSTSSASAVEVELAAGLEATPTASKPSMAAPAAPMAPLSASPSAPIAPAASAAPKPAPVAPAAAPAGSKPAPLAPTAAPAASKPTPSNSQPASVAAKSGSVAAAPPVSARSAPVAPKAAAAIPNPAFESRPASASSKPAFESSTPASASSKPASESLRPASPSSKAASAPAKPASPSSKPASLAAKPAVAPPSKLVEAPPPVSRTEVDEHDGAPLPRRSTWPLVLGLVVVIGVVWAGVRFFTAKPTSQSAVETASETRAASSAAEQAAADSATAPPVTQVRPKPTAPPAKTKLPATETDVSSAGINEVLPEVPQRAKRTIRGHVRVSVRVIVEQDGTVFAALAEQRGPSRYFERLAVEAAKKWTFPAAETSAQRLMLVKFDFTRDGTTADAAAVK